MEQLKKKHIALDMEQILDSNYETVTVLVTKMIVLAIKTINVFGNQKVCFVDQNKDQKVHIWWPKTTAVMVNR